MDNGSLKILIEKGVKPRRGIPGLVLSHFAEFTEARALGWSWSDIAEALGRPGEEKGFSTAFCKIKKRIDAGKLKLKPPAVGELAERKEVVPEKKRWIPAPKEEKKEVPGSDEPASSATGTTGSTGVRGPIQKKDESGEKKVHLIEEDDQKEKNLFERSKLY